MSTDARAAAPAPVLPAFAADCLTNVVPGLLGVVEPGGEGGGGVPPWMPGVVAGARQVVLLVLDGLGWLQLRARASLAPTLAGAAGGPITSVAPSTTACALTSLTTGLPPAVHGVVGYRVHVGGDVMNVLQWRRGQVDARQSVPPRRFQPHPVFALRLGADGGRASLDGRVRPRPVVSRSDYGATGFTAAHLGDSVLIGCAAASSLAPTVGRLLRSGEPFVYAYYDGVDRIAHAHGLGELYDAELRTADRIVADIAAELVPGAVLVVTADHGQVEVGSSVEVLGTEVMEGVTLLSGEGRFRWLHTVPGAAADVAATARSLHGERAWVRTREQILDEGWLGGEPVPEVADRLGDVVLVPFEPTAFMDPADTGELRLVARHGSLTADEMLVPLLAIGAPG